MLLLKHKYHVSITCRDTKCIRACKLYFLMQFNADSLNMAYWTITLKRDIIGIVWSCYYNDKCQINWWTLPSRWDDAFSSAGLPGFSSNFFCFTNTPTIWTSDIFTHSAAALSPWTPSQTRSSVLHQSVILTRCSPVEES